MCDVIAVSWRDLPQTLIDQCRLKPYDRGNGDPEYHFGFDEHSPRLPVQCEGQLLILPWVGYCDQEALTAGSWAKQKPEPVQIPAILCRDKGVWYPVSDGLKGVLVGRQVYLLTEASSHYYKIMTRHGRMPVMIGEGI